MNKRSVNRCQLESLIITINAQAQVYVYNVHYEIHKFQNKFSWWVGGIVIIIGASQHQITQNVIESFFVCVLVFDSTTSKKIEISNSDASQVIFVDFCL